MFGATIEGTEFTVSNTDVGVVDVAIYDVGDNTIGVQSFAPGIGECTELEERRTLIEIEILTELRRVTVDHATERKDNEPSLTSPSAARRRKKLVRPSK